jgi:hypothetical protein
MAHNIQFTATRKEEHNIIVIVFDCRVSSQLLDAQSVIDSIKKSITEWIYETEEGKKEWADSVEDFNFADFALQNFSYGELAERLVRNNVFGIKTSSLHDALDVSLDTVLKN